MSKTSQPYLGKPRVMLRTDNFRLSMYPAIGIDDSLITGDDGTCTLEIHSYAERKAVKRNVYRWRENPATKQGEWESIWNEFQLDPKAILWSLVRVLKQCYDETQQFVDLDRSQT